MTDPASTQPSTQPSTSTSRQASLSRQVSLSRQPSLSRQIVLARRPDPDLGPDCFRLQDYETPEPADGEALLEVEALVMDPAIRLWMTKDSYFPAVAVGEAIRGGAAARVVRSRTPMLVEGSYVTGLFGWQTHAITRGDEYTNIVVPDGVDPLVALALNTGSGPTAWFGLMEIGQPKKGETVLVSGAAGSIGSLVGQIARNSGCRVVGLAGSAQKCAYVVDELGFDECVDYHCADLVAELKRVCPRGVDVYFDNVGGSVLAAALHVLAERARIVACGAISQFGNDLPPWPKNFPGVLSAKRVRMQGFLTLDYLPRFAEATAPLAAWIEQGTLRYRTETRVGLSAAPDALASLFQGENLGKVLVDIRRDVAALTDRSDA